MFSEDDLIPISALQHALFCERQYALIHLEQLWEENRFTAEGRVLHERVDAEHHESRKSFRQEFGLAVRSLEFGLIGKCDLVELWFSSDGIKQVCPVEFKRGKDKESDVDRVQLCAQALCLEEMLSVKIDTGQLYYLQQHRRTDVVLDESLRDKTRELIERIQNIKSHEITPHAEYAKQKCDRCSMLDVCMPKSASGTKQVVQFVENQIKRMRRFCADEESA
jgi:CRISPR-associated exonuclease Cas4